MLAAESGQLIELTSPLGAGFFFSQNNENQDRIIRVLWIPGSDFSSLLLSLASG